MKRSAEDFEADVALPHGRRAWLPFHCRLRFHGRMRHLFFGVLVALSTSVFAQQYVLPAAGNVFGNEGTHFRSDVAIWNLRDVSQRIQVRWLPQGTSGKDLPPIELVVPPYSGIQDEDFVANVLKREGLGAVSFLAVRSDGTADLNARLNIQSRIWTPQAGTRGFTSQSFDAVRITQLVGDHRIITNQRSEFRYRMNLGIANLDSTGEHTWQVRAGTFTTSVTVPAYGFQMITVPAFEYQGGAPLVHVDATGSSATSWVAFGSSVENVSGDAWTSLAYDASVP
jgi:hypothetical protein